MHLNHFRKAALAQKRAARLAFAGNCLVLASILYMAFKLPVWGCAAMLLGNLVFFRYGIISGHRSFCVFNVIFAIFSLIGIINWIV